MESVEDENKIIFLNFKGETLVLDSPSGGEPQLSTVDDMRKKLAPFPKFLERFNKELEKFLKESK